MAEGAQGQTGCDGINRCVLDSGVEHTGAQEVEAGTGMLVNPSTVRARCADRETDRIDARRIAEYLQYGLLRASYIPPRPVRQLRDLTRMRTYIQW